MQRISSPCLHLGLKLLARAEYLFVEEGYEFDGRIRIVETEALIICARIASLATILSPFGSLDIGPAEQVVHLKDGGNWWECQCRRRRLVEKVHGQTK